jgi:hypothetical protein
MMRLTRSRYGVWYLFRILIALYLCGLAIRADPTSRLFLPITIDLGAIFGIGLDEMTAGHGLSTLLKLLLFTRGVEQVARI